MSTVAATAAMVCARSRAMASWDTNPSPKPLKIPKVPKSTPSSSTPSPVVAAAVAEKLNELSLSDFLKSARSRTNIEPDQFYLGYERWLPSAPEVKKPRSIYNAASLAYLGDCIYELYARRHFLYPPLNINEYNGRVMKVVCCESQDLLLKKLLAEDYLTEDERNVLRWGKNKSGNKTKTTKRAGVAIYNSASSLETLAKLYNSIGYLYLTDVKRLEELMYKLGFSTGASSEVVAEELRANFRKQPAIPNSLGN